MDCSLLDWYQTFTPSTITFHNIQTGKQVQEPSLVALQIDKSEKKKDVPFTVGGSNASLSIERCVAVGGTALDYETAPDTVVFSPLRYGQIADYTVTQYLLRELFRRVRSKFSASALFKPILCIHEQKRTTEVEERALIDGGLQLGARRVLLYQDSFPSMLERARNDPKLRNGYILHIESQD